MKLSLLSPNNFKEERNKIFFKSTQQNSIKDLNNSNEDDSIPSFFKLKKKFEKNRRLSLIDRKFDLKNTFQYINLFWRQNKEKKYYSEENDSISKLINIKKYNELNDNYNKFHKQKKSRKTEIILKKVRFHDFIDRKKNNRNNIKNKIKTRNEEDKKENNEFNYYIPVHGILFHKKIDNNFLQRNIKQNIFIEGNPYSTKNKTPKININNKKVKFNSSLPLINEKDFKNKTQNAFFNKKNITKKRIFISDEINNKKKSKKEINLTNIHGYKKLTNLNMISIPGSDYGKTKKNQDSYFIIPKIDNCEEIKIFGIFDGHGENGDILSQEIKEYFKNYFINLFNKNSEKEEEEYFKNNFTIKSINHKQKQDFTNNYNYNLNKLTDSKINFNYSEEIKLQNLSNKLKQKADKVKYIYNKLSSNDYSEIFYSYKKLEETLHNKYSNSDFCVLSGSTSLILFLFNSKKFNKIITSNLGDSKTILISQKNTIKELNTVHTLNNPEEKKRIIKNGGVINRLNVGPLRIWFKNKNYPGLSITRSLGDFERDSLGVISIPDIKEYDLDEELIKILIFGTDGVWKFMTNDQIMNIVLPYYEKDDAKGATQKIKEIANNLWNVKNPKGIADITVFVLFFK